MIDFNVVLSKLYKRKNIAQEVSDINIRIYDIEYIISSFERKDFDKCSVKEVDEYIKMIENLKNEYYELLRKKKMYEELM